MWDFLQGFTILIPYEAFICEDFERVVFLIKSLLPSDKTAKSVECGPWPRDGVYKAADISANTLSLRLTPHLLKQVSYHKGADTLLLGLQ